MTGVAISVADSLGLGVGQVQSLVPPTVRTAAVSLVGFAVLAGVTAGVTAISYRRVTTRAVPVGTGILVGLLPVAVWLAVRIATGNAVVAGLSIVLDATGYFLLTAFGVSATVATGGRRLGDALACDVFDISRVTQSAQTAEFRRSARRPATVELPDTIRDRSGSEPVDPAVKRDLEGCSWAFPGGLSMTALESRVIARLERDYGIERVAVDLVDEHEVSTLAIGREPSGISPELPPRTVGTAVRGQVVPDVTVGDPIELWRTGDDRVEFAGTATLYAATQHTATLVLPARDAGAVSGADGIKLTTKPAVSDDVDAFLSVLRATDHSIAMLSIESGAPLEGEFVGWLPVSVLVIVRDGEVIPFPAVTETVRSGDDVYVLGGPGEFYELATFESERRSHLDS